MKCKMAARHPLSVYDRGRLFGRFKVGQSVIIVTRVMGVSNSIILRFQKFLKMEMLRKSMPAVVEEAPS